MHLLDLPTESIPQHDIVVKLVPPRRGRERGAGELCERGQVEAVDEAVEGVERREDGGGGQESRIHFYLFFFFFRWLARATGEIGGDTEGAPILI